ncbi:Histone-like nucleoid-structuring protein H-NS [Cupriavidus necator]|uniref:Histone-like nucleoid-structuring protein H-NS n=1 Tax=Cupriavidus necator TaxID=106590 RepID=A0A1K0IKX4_CUPNE|nr:Histone-like nucleoid-structuring protein H-NS [Cupriavidus necator]
MATYKQLIAQKQALEAQLQEARATEVGQVIEQIQGLMAEYGLSVDDVAPKRRRGRPASGGTNQDQTKKEPLPAKYMDPKTGKTWSGRGRTPAWLGKRPERFLIQA